MCSFMYLQLLTLLVKMTKVATHWSCKHAFKGHLNVLLISPLGFTMMCLDSFGLI